MERRYTSGTLSFLVTFGPLDYTIQVHGAGQADTFDVSEYSMHDYVNPSYQRDGYADLGAWLIAGLLSESPFWGERAAWTGETFEILPI